MRTLQVHFDSYMIIMDGAMDGAERCTAPDMPLDIFTQPDLGNRRPMITANYDGVVLTTERRSRVRGMPDTERFMHDEAEMLLAPFKAIAEAAKQQRIEAKAAADAQVAADIEESRKINERRAPQDEADHQERLRVERAAENARRDAQIAVGGIPNAKE